MTDGAEPGLVTTARPRPGSQTATHSCTNDLRSLSTGNALDLLDLKCD
jgi:hypothetical protein